MVAQGWALAFIRYSSTYVEDEKAARAARRRLWSGAFIAPWDWRSRSTSTVIHGAVEVFRPVRSSSSTRSRELEPPLARVRSRKLQGGWLLHLRNQVSAFTTRCT